ncbi:MAG: aspartyl protease family protein [Candidatus Poribacteria bacterium]|nr:aspartyl protease family protein [Candidatus Poribacteria bacterium]
MGITHVDAEIANAARPRETRHLRFLVDTGAHYSVAPGSVLRALGIEPTEEQRFSLANGDEIVRDVGYAVFKYDGRTVASKIILGETGESNLFGIVTLEEFGFALDPIHRKLLPRTLFM